MKKCFYLFIPLLLPIFFSPAEAFDIKGLQPVPPHGIFSTFSAESFKQNQLGISLEVERAVSTDFYRTTLKGAYGLHDSVEFLFSVPYVFANKDGGDGVEDISIGVKHRLVDESAYGPAFAYLLTVSAPVQNENISTNGRTGGGLILTKKVGPFKGHLNLLYLRPQMSELHDEYDLNMGAELAFAHNMTFLAEIVGRKNFYKEKLDFIEWKLGYRIANSDHIFTTIGAGFNMNNGSPEFRMLFSVSAVLPFTKTKTQKVYDE